ncbi:hypothetical protein AMTR_s00055p00156700 [Amborella trichopoda]|uniref:Uncharacterized protein n=1 Tax=Amborella trichopoda TaxID=13333 RepID=U5D741_AMBTC|nr:hypothetical protein AMTR_s00055p00156700 [Amborella trichopoda]
MQRRSSSFRLAASKQVEYRPPKGVLEEDNVPMFVIKEEMTEVVVGEENDVPRIVIEEVVVGTRLICCMMRESKEPVSVLAMLWVLTLIPQLGWFIKENLAKANKAGYNSQDERDIGGHEPVWGGSGTETKRLAPTVVAARVRDMVPCLLLV